MAAGRGNLVIRAARSAWGRILALSVSREQLIDAALLLFVILTGVLVVGSFSAALAGSGDNDWGAARTLLGGLDPYKVYLACAPCREAPFLPAVDPMYPASGLVLLWPLAALSWPAAKFVWAAFNLTAGVCLVLALYDLYLPLASWRQRAFGVCTFMSGAPFLTNLAIGQHAVFALSWFVAALWVERRGKAALAAVFLALSWFKYTLTFPLSLIFALRARWTTLWAAGAIHVALTILAAAWTGSSPLALLLEPLQVVRIVNRAGHLDIFGLAMRLGLTSMLLPIVVVCGLLAAVAVQILRHRNERDVLLLCLLSLFAYSVVYHLAYDLVVLVFPLIYVLAEISARSGRTTIHRYWIFMLAALIGWTWFGDHVVQLLKQHHVEWVIQAYPYYYGALAIWLYTTMFLGFVLLSARAGWKSVLYAVLPKVWVLLRQGKAALEQRVKQLPLGVMRKIRLRPRVGEVRRNFFG